MSAIEQLLTLQISQALQILYGLPENTETKVEHTNKDYKGDYTFVVFPYLRYSKKKPQETAQEIGEHLIRHCPEVVAYEVVQGFLNLSIGNNYWLEALQTAANTTNYGQNQSGNGQKVMLEYSSPNTNKPLHLGHIRNNLLGFSLANILQFNGYHVIKANLINDRGIHICKSMLAWKKFGHGETPESSGLKGDHLVGKYYVIFDKAYKEEVSKRIASGISEEDAAKEAPLLKEAQEMLRNWEAGDPEVRQLWEEMNQWVYNGFEKTYERLGVDFDQYYYESKTYLLGKKLVQEGLNLGEFYAKEDGSVWANLEEYGLDEKLLLRADGTSVYITQDLGTAELKYEDHGAEKSIYVVGNEQDYHFKVLQLLLKKLKKTYADGIHHMSYGMVDLPSGKMKSREGTVVDADDLMDEMRDTAKKRTDELGKTEGMDAVELSNLYEMLGQGALKYFILKVDPVKRMLFNPEESIDFQGDTGPFIQYTHARIRSILRNAELPDTLNGAIELNEAEKELIRSIHDYPAEVHAAGKLMSPAVIAHYAHELARTYNRFYHDCPILHEKNADLKALRIMLSYASGQILKSACALLGIQVPERM